MENKKAMYKNLFETIMWIAVAVGLIIAVGYVVSYLWNL